MVVDTIGTLNKISEIDVLDELWHRKSIRQHVREFAVIFSIIFLVVAGYNIHMRGSTVVVTSLIGAAGLFLFLGYCLPLILHPVWKAWMGFAHVLGIVMTTVILSIAWTVVVIPTAVLLKLTGKYVMDLRYNADVESYWDEREDKQNDFILLERQF